MQAIERKEREPSCPSSRMKQDEHRQMEKSEHHQAWKKRQAQQLNLDW
jgi:hypothetical protein